MTTAKNFIPTRENVDFSKIYEYDNLKSINSFKFFRGNRAVNPKNVKELRKAIDENSDFIPSITVNINNMTIVDGQNRWSAFREHYKNGGKNIMRVIYINVDESNEDSLIRDLQKGKKWDGKDFFKRAKDNGNKAAIDLYEWAGKHPLCMNKNGKINPSYAMAFLYGKRKDTEVRELTLKQLSQKDLKESEDVYNEVKTMISKLGWKRGAWMESFIQAWKSVRGGEYKYLLDEMGFDYFSDHIFNEMIGVQTLSGKPMWENQFKHLILNINQSYRTA